MHEEGSINKVSKSKAKKQRKLNLTRPEIKTEKKNSSRTTLNLGKGLVMELKEFRNTYYIGLEKYGEGQQVRNRFNIPLDQLEVLKKRPMR
ncbi:hypothetical protein AVEN_7993-1 [Araneus ventricosus]|uniref:Uncharacterized protein n=1 Tax=Araneus ventricosus TaxID=182803 RepID=A0A4Y2W5I6_ARAVE|nr:hypothetical protein AVEN_7993-1 [Araneus ventricosus]